MTFMDGGRGDRSRKPLVGYDEDLSDDMPMTAWQETRNRQVREGGLCRTPDARPQWSLTINRDFLRKVENSKRQISVPATGAGQVIGHSGPTVCVGIDLGQKDRRYLENLGLAPQLRAKLDPYLGLRGQPAAAFVKANPLTLSQKECDHLNEAVQTLEFSKLERRFDADSQVGPLAALPRDTRTAIASVFFQYGADAPQKAAPKFWQQITTGDWVGARDNLLNFGDAHKERRGQEARLIEGDLRSGALSRSPQ